MNYRHVVLPMVGQSILTMQNVISEKYSETQY